MKHSAIRMERKKINRPLIITLVLVATIAGYSRPYLGEQASSNKPAPLPELGVDDGFACVLFYGSDIDGNLEPCG